MKLNRIIALLALVAMSIVPLTASAANYTKEELSPAKIQVCKDKQGGLDMTYFQVKDLKNVPARHVVNRGIINAVGDLILEHKAELEAGKCTMKITNQIRHNDAGILSATFLSEGTVKGAAHGFKTMKAINFNYITGEEITPDALNKLYLAAKETPAYTTANIDSLLQKQAKAGKLDLIVGYKGIDKLPQFYLEGPALDIVAFFQPYEVAPYAAGIVTVKVD